MICDMCKWYDWYVLVDHGHATFVDECPFHPNRTGAFITECEDYEEAKWESDEVTDEE